MVRFIKDSLPDNWRTDFTVLLELIRNYSERFKDMQGITQCGKGGESLVLTGDVVGRNIIMKVPVDDSGKSGGFDSAIEET